MWLTNAYGVLTDGRDLPVSTCESKLAEIPAADAALRRLSVRCSAPAATPAQSCPAPHRPVCTRVGLIDSLSLNSTGESVATPSVADIRTHHRQEAPMPINEPSIKGVLAGPNIAQDEVFAWEATRMRKPPRRSHYRHGR